MGESFEDPAALRRLFRHALHDLANVLTCILAAASHRPRDSAEVEENLSAIATAAELGRQLLAAMRSFPVDGRPAAIGSVLSATSILLRCVAQPAGVDVTTEVEDVVVGIPAHELQEIVVNLGLNAIEAMPDGGLLAIAVAAAGDRVLLSVHDDGEGVDPSLLSDPISTKGPSRGAGLASILRILNRCGGSIDVTSDGAGTTFVVHLPRG